MKGPRNGAGYVRVSTDEQMRSTLGVRSYLDTIVRYADSNDVDLGRPCTACLVDGMPLVDATGATFQSRERLIIESASAYKTRFRDRPGAKAALRMLDACQGIDLLFAKVDRSFRNTVDGVTTLSWLRNDLGIHPHFIDLGGLDYNGSTPAGFGLMFALYVAMAEAESERISDRVRAAHRVARLSGRPATHSPPTGFMWVGVGKHRQAHVDPRQIALLREIGRWIDAGWGFERIYKELRRLDINALGRSPAHRALWGDDLRERTVRRWMRDAKEMRTIYEDTGLWPEADGQAWLAEKYRRAEIASAERDKKRRARRAKAARARLRTYVESADGAASS